MSASAFYYNAPSPPACNCLCLNSVLYQLETNLLATHMFVSMLEILLTYSQIHAMCLLLDFMGQVTQAKHIAHAFMYWCGRGDACDDEMTCAATDVHQARVHASRCAV